MSGLEWLTVAGAVVWYVGGMRVLVKVRRADDLARREAAS